MRASGKISIFFEFMALLMGQTSSLFRPSKLVRSLATYGGKRQEVAMVVCVSFAGCQLLVGVGRPLESRTPVPLPQLASADTAVSCLGVQGW